MNILNWVYLYDDSMISFFCTKPTSSEGFGIDSYKVLACRKYLQLVENRSIADGNGEYLERFVTSWKKENISTFLIRKKKEVIIKRHMSLKLLA